MIKLAYLGTGYINSVHVAAADKLVEAQSFAVYSRNRDRGTAFANHHNLRYSYTDYDELLSNSDIDAVIIGLPTPLHMDFTIKAMQAGKHVLCEKPIASSVEEAQHMIGTAEQTDVVLMIAHVLRFWPEYVAAKSIVNDSTLGKVRMLSATRLNSTPAWSSGNWLLDPRQSGGVPVDLHIHDLDFFRWLMGDPLSVQAVGTQNDLGLIDSIITLLNYKDAVAQATAGFILTQNDKFRMSFKVFCEQGMIEYDNLTTPTIIVRKEGKIRSSPKFPQQDAYVAQLRYFIHCIKTEKAPLIAPPQEALKSLELALQVKTLVEQGKATRRG